MEQPEKLYPIFSVIALVRDMFEFPVSKRKLLETCHIPLADIGNYHVKEKDEIVQIQKSDDGMHGQISLDCKTFTVKKILSDPCFTSPVTVEEGAYPYLNNSVRYVEYVNQNSMIDYENIFDKFGNFIGQVKGGQFYDKYGEPAGEADIQTIKLEKAKSGSTFTFPLPYKLDGCKILFNISRVGQQVRVQYDYLVDDENGFPLIDEKTKTAIAFYMNYLRQMNLYFQQQIPKQFMDSAQQLYEQKAGLARGSYVMSENMKAQIINRIMSFEKSFYNADLEEEV